MNVYVFLLYSPRNPKRPAIQRYICVLFTFYMYKSILAVCIESVLFMAIYILYTIRPAISGPTNFTHVQHFGPYQSLNPEDMPVSKTLG